MRLEKFKQEVREQFNELKDTDCILEVEKFLKDTYRRAKSEGDKELYNTALNAYNRLLYLNNEI